MLSDGHERDAGQILAEAVKPVCFPRKRAGSKLYTSLYECVQRSIAHGRRPLIMQNEATHAFRINHPVDDWPDVELPARRPWLT